MFKKFYKFSFAVLLLFFVASYSSQSEVKAQEACPVDLGELEVQADLALPVLNDTIAQVNGLLDLLEPLQALDPTGLLDPLIDSLLDIVTNTTALAENLELLLGADTADEQCAIAADICVQSQSLTTLIGGLPEIVTSTVDSVLPLPILGSLLESVLDVLFGTVDFLLGTTQPVLGNLVSVSCSQEVPVNECEFIGDSPVCSDPNCADEEVAEGVTCDDFNQDPEGECGDTVSCDDPNCVGVGECEVPECEFFENGSPDCSNEVCAVEEIAEGVTCDDFNQDPESFCGDAVSCDDPNCEGTQACEDDSGSQPPARSNGNGGGCTVAAAGTVSLANLLIPLLPLAGVYTFRRLRRRT